jgi:hypothetical protein
MKSLAVRAAGFALLALCAAVPNAHATLQLKLSDGTTTVVITDNNLSPCTPNAAVCVGGDVNPNTDSIGWFGSLGSGTSKWNLGVTSAFSIHPGNPTILDLHVVISNAPTLAGKTLTIWATDSGFAPPASSFSFSPSGSSSNMLTETAAAWTGVNNFDTTTPLGSLSFGACGAQTPPASTCTFGNTVVTNVNSAVPTYSATIQAAISTHDTHGGTMSLDYQLAAASVPEPAVVTLLGGVLLLTAGAIRRKAARS